MTGILANVVFSVLSLMAASSFIPARSNSLFLAGCPIEFKRAFSNVNCAYSSFGMVKLSRSILTFSDLTFLGAFLSDCLVAAFFGITFFGVTFFGVAFLTATFLATTAGFANIVLGLTITGLAATLTAAAFIVVLDALDGIAFEGVALVVTGFTVFALMAADLTAVEGAEVELAAALVVSDITIS